MEREYRVLQKKLDDLQSRLTELFFHHSDQEDSSDASPPEQQRQLFREDIAARFGFLKTLLAAEIDSHADQDIPHRLNRIAKRLTALEDGFHNWVELGVCLSPLDNTVGDVVHDDDTLPCSCTLSCQFDDDHEEEVGEEPVVVLVPDGNENENETETENEEEVVQSFSSQLFPDENGNENESEEAEVVQGFPSQELGPEENEEEEEEVLQGFASRQDKRRARRRERFSCRPCRFLGTALAVVAAVIGLVTIFMEEEEVVYLVPT